MTIGRWKPAWPTRRPLQTVPMPPAPSSWRIRYLAASAIRPLGEQRAGGWQRPPGVSRNTHSPSGYTRPRMRYLGLDVGDVRIGVALSDETATLATGLPTLKRGGPV